MQLIDELNSKSKFGKTFGLNFFADQTEEERQSVLGLPKNRAPSANGERDDKVPVTEYPNKKGTLPDSKDWRNDK